MPKIKYRDKGLVKQILSWKVMVVLSNVIFQGMLYMSMGERLYKLLITIVFGGLVYLIVDDVLISLILGHFLNFVFNGQFYVLYRYLSPKEVMTKEGLLGFLNAVSKVSSILKPKDVLLIGSFCRGGMSKTSDLDIRIFHDKSFFSSLKAYFMASLLRFYGLVFRFPVDIFCFSDLSFLNKISRDEVPACFYKHSDIFGVYPTAELVSKKLETLVIK
jgi:predicted nucleotidyltransferase